MPDGAAKHTLRDVQDLIEAGFVSPSARAALNMVARRYAIAIPPALAALISAADDPIGRQFIPDADELIIAPHETADPIGDDALSPVKGIVHRYPDRALLKPLLACPVYCRFCFRREQVGPSGGVLTDAELNAACAYIAANPQINEVILTGGDPLILSPRRLSAILARLMAIPHVTLLRIHTRAPIADPALVTNELVDALDISTPLFMVLHANHARELTAPVTASLRKVQLRGIPVLGQTVLLAGVNDQEEVLGDLFRAMLRARIKPYYLHQLDAAPGTSRFHVPMARGLEIMKNLRGNISGTALPIYVYDQPGGLGKLAVR